MKFCVYLAVFILGLPVIYPMPMTASVTVDVNENKNEVTCTYLNGDFDSQFSYLIIKFDNMTCNVLNSANDCLETLKAEGVVQITDSHPCTRVDGSNQVHCWIDHARVKEICCQLDSQRKCSPMLSPTTTLLPAGSTSTTTTDTGETITKSTNEWSSEQVVGLVAGLVVGLVVALVIVVGSVLITVVWWRFGNRCKTVVMNRDEQVSPPEVNQDEQVSPQGEQVPLQPNDGTITEQGIEETPSRIGLPSTANYRELNEGNSDEGYSETTQQTAVPFQSVVGPSVMLEPGGNDSKPEEENNVLPKDIQETNAAAADQLFIYNQSHKKEEEESILINSSCLVLLKEPEQCEQES